MKGIAAQHSRHVNRIIYCNKRFYEAAENFSQQQYIKHVDDILEEVHQDGFKKGVEINQILTKRKPLWRRLFGL
jgi:hypothetical protein